MNDELALREKARESIHRGKLPGRPPDRTWVGPGVGASCALCGEPIRRDQVECEIVFKHDGDGDEPWLDPFHLHHRCFSAWELERVTQGFEASQYPAESMDLEAIRVLVRSKLQDGRLPQEGAARICGAPGIGELCGACESRIDESQLAMVVPLRAHETFITLHADCYTLWNAERNGHQP
jgi:hypothetical protein